MLLNKHFRMEENNGEGNELGGAAPDKGNSQQVELLTKTVGLLAEGLQKMELSQQDIVSTLAKITEQPVAQTQQQLEHKFGDDVDLEQLSRKDLAAYIVDNIGKSFQKELEKISKNFDDRVSDLSSRFESKNASEMVSNAAKDHADFWEWSNEIKALIQEHPNMSVVRAYNLAKSENPEKDKQMKAKYEKPAEKRANPFITLTPTSSVGSRGDSGKMNAREAAEKAFDDVMSAVGDSLLNNHNRNVA